MMPCMEIISTPPIPFILHHCPLLPPVEGNHGNDGLLLGRPLEEPDQPITEKSLLEILDGIVMMYNLSVHQQLGKVSGKTLRPCKSAVTS